MAQSFSAAWAEVKKRREQETRMASAQQQREQQRAHSAASVALPHPAKPSQPLKSQGRRKPVSSIDHLIAQLANPTLEAAIMDAEWTKSRQEAYDKDPRNFRYATRLNSWGK